MQRAGQLDSAQRLSKLRAHGSRQVLDVRNLDQDGLLCGRDPHGYANVGWLLGLHDRPGGERPVFGTVRYMNAAGLERKFDMKGYVGMVEAFER